MSACRLIQFNEFTVLHELMSDSVHVFLSLYEKHCLMEHLSV